MQRHGPGCGRSRSCCAVDSRAAALYSAARPCCIRRAAFCNAGAPPLLLHAGRAACLATITPHQLPTASKTHSSRSCLTDCKLSPPLRTSSLISRCPRQRPAARECACRTRPDARSHPAPPQQGGGQCHEGQGPHEAALLLPGACDRPAIIDCAASLTQSPHSFVRSPAATRMATSATSRARRTCAR